MIAGNNSAEDMCMGHYGHDVPADQLYEGWANPASGSGKHSRGSMSKDIIPFPDLSTPCCGVIDKISISLRKDEYISALYIKVFEQKFPQGCYYFIHFSLQYIDNLA